MARAQATMDRDDRGLLIDMGAGRDPHRPRPAVATELAGERVEGVGHADVELEVAGLDHMLGHRPQSHEAHRVRHRLCGDGVHGAQRAADQGREHAVAAQRTLRQSRIDDVRGDAAIAAAEQQVRPQFGFHDQRRMRPVVREETTDRTGQVVRQVDVIYLVTPQRAHALGAGRRDRGDQQPQVGTAAPQCVHQRHRGVDLADRHRVQPQRAAPRGVAIHRVALRPALEICRLAEAAPDQVVDRDRRQQVQRDRVQAAQQALDGIFPHRGRIANPAPSRQLACRANRRKPARR